MLQGRRPRPTIPASDLARARAWYAGTFGLTTDQEEPEALRYRRGSDRLFLLLPPLVPRPPSTSWPRGSWRTWPQR